MFMLTRVSSAMPTTETSDEALIRRMNSLMSGGVETLQRLRQKNAPPDIEAGEAERGRRLALPARHGVERAAQDFRLIGRRRERQRADRRHDRRHVEPVFGEKIIDEQELHEQRNAAKHADIRAAETPEPGARRNARDADERADHEPEHDAGEGHGDRRRRRLREIAERVEDDLGFHLAWPIASARPGSLDSVLRDAMLRIAPQDEAVVNSALERALILRSAA